MQLFAFTPYVAAWTLLPALLTRWSGAGGRRPRWPGSPLLAMTVAVLPRALPDRHRGAATGTDAARAHRRTCSSVAPTRPPIVEPGPRTTTSRCSPCRSSPPRRGTALDRGRADRAAPVLAAGPGGRHHRLGPLLPVPDHRRRASAATPAVRLPAGVRRRSSRPALPRCWSSRRTRSRRTPCRSSTSGAATWRQRAAGHPGRAAADPARRLQRDPRPRARCAP